MPKYLFESIHDSAYPNRSTPATLDEFVAFGLEQRDYVQYVALQHCLQGELLLYGFPREHSFLNKEKNRVTTYPTIEKLIKFCIDKKLIEDDAHWHEEMYYLSLFKREDAEYFHDWIRVPRDEHEFRLCVERKLSPWWDEEESYISDTFGIISFVYDNYQKCGENHFIVDFDSPVRIRRFNPDTKDFTILGHVEVKKLFDIALREKRNIETELAKHYELMPDKNAEDATTKAVPWVKKLCDLYDRQAIIEEVFEQMEDAVTTEDVYRFKENDVLHVICGTDDCENEGHLIKPMRVEFSYYSKPDKQYNIRRCSHCQSFQISLEELINMFDTYGVPRCKIVYDDDRGDFSGFAESSVFYDMGYTVSQSVGLTKEKRQSILKHAIASGKTSKYDVLMFLKQRIQINGQKVGNEIALKKWKEDYDFIRHL